MLIGVIRLEMKVSFIWFMCLFRGVLINGGEINFIEGY